MADVRYGPEWGSHLDALESDSPALPDQAAVRRDDRSSCGNGGRADNTSGPDNGRAAILCPVP